MLQKILRSLERKRIKTHLKNMEKQLRKNTPKNLSKTLLAERQKNIKHLHDYCTKEEFPKNTKYPGQILPQIKDESGIPCAMAYIIEKSGKTELVEELHTNNNLVYLEEVNEGPVIQWTEQSGLTKKETEQIQPTYCYETCQFFGEIGYWFFPLLFASVSIGLGFLGFKIIKKRNWKKITKIITISLTGFGSVIVGIAVMLATMLMTGPDYAV